MATVTRYYCPVCCEERRCSRESVNHILHLFLSFITWFLWLVVWAIMARKAKRTWSCDTCGASVPVGKDDWKIVGKTAAVLAILGATMFLIALVKESV